ncbi:MAG: hypothetical protein H0X41_07310 [Chitinophagaceae bacterium]|nr:hypothetical protein [Chitinophagaceae bacterium]
MQRRILFILFLPVLCALIMIVSAACEKNALESKTAQAGKGGSITRFTIAKNCLYAVTNHNLMAYNLSDPQKPELTYTSNVNFDIETIYPYGNYLFLGTRTGLYIYSIDTASAPRLIGEARHARSCDPVVVNDSVAFVTLKSSGACGPALAGLYVHDIKSMTMPVVKATISLPDPGGLGIQDSVLFVCCGREGLKVFNVRHPYSPILLSTIKDANYIDVIPDNGTLICSTNTGILLYDITNPSSPVFKKEIDD